MRRIDGGRYAAAGRVACRWSGVMALLGSLGAAAGCHSTWRPPLEGVQAATATMTVVLAERVAPPGASYTYRRTFPERRDLPADEYDVRFTRSQRAEGRLASSDVDSLEGHLLPGGPEPAEYSFPWPEKEDPVAAGFFLAFDPPLINCPRFMQGGIPFVCGSKVRCHGAKGRHIYNGKARRTFVFEGYETVVIDDVPHTDCVRLRVDTLIEFPWVARVEATEYVWLAPHVGEVERLRRLRGFMLLTYFECVERYELVRMELPRQPEEGAARDGQALDAWRRCAVYLRPALPAPRLQGLLVDLVAEERAESAK